MSEAPGSPDLATDALLGRLAVQRGYLTDEQLRLAFEDRDREIAAGRAQPRPLGNILVARKFVTDSQLIELLDDLRLRRSGRSVPAALGKYRIRRELGRGGMGVVYEAVDGELGRTVALKLMLIPPAEATAEETLEEEERFLREARVSAGLPRHPGIVGVYEAGVIENKRYLAMEFIQGQSMAEWRKSPDVPLTRQVALLRDVLAAIHHAHQNGIIHRDLKPQNILVDAEGRPHVVDFGLARAVSREHRMTLTASGMLVGTPAYMSPEQARGVKAIDRKSDIWATGVMLFEILAGRLPFTGDSPVDLLMRVVKNPVPPPVRTGMRGARTEPQRDLEAACLKALAKDPAERYATAQAFADDLMRWLKGEPVHARPAAPKRARLPVTTLAGAAAALVLALVVYALWPAPKPPGPPPKIPEIVRRPNPPPPKDQVPDPPPAAEEKAKPPPTEERKPEPPPVVARPVPEPAKPEPAPPTPTPLVTPAKEIAEPNVDDPAVWKNAISLLPLVKPERDAVIGKWTMSDKGLRTDATSYAGLLIPYDPPEEYDFRIRFIAEGQTPDVNQVLSQAGRPFQWLLGAYFNTTIGFALHRGQPGSGSPSVVRREKILTTGKVHTSVVQVRRGGLSGYLDGKFEVRWNDYASLKLDPRLKMPAEIKLGLTSYQCATVFQSIEILEITGQGRPLVREAAEPAKAERMSVLLDPAKRIAMEFVQIQPGRFSRTQGKEMQEVTLTAPYWIQTTETTQSQWEAVMKSNPSFNKGADLPVETVSWNDAQKFIQELAKRVADRKPGLPTEAEWEYACRAGSESRWNWGEKPEDGDAFGWFSTNSGGHTNPVARKKPNAWGLYDMHGNVREWCQDAFGPYAGSVRDPQGPSTGKTRVIRGGASILDAKFSSLDLRENMDPTWKERYLGLRIVLR